jgi:exodeoxyribonuclease I
MGISAKGKPTLRLDTLAPENGFAHENAHDALADVEATIYMARLIRDRAPAVWNSLMPLVEKGEVTAQLTMGAFIPVASQITDRMAAFVARTYAISHLRL